MQIQDANESLHNFEDFFQLNIIRLFLLMILNALQKLSIEKKKNLKNLNHVEPSCTFTGTHFSLHNHVYLLLHERT